LNSATKFSTEERAHHLINGMLASEERADLGL